MKRNNDASSLGLTLLIVIAFVVLAVVSSNSINNLSSINQGDAVFAGSQESVDSTVAPTDASFFDSEESVDATATPRPTSTLKATTASPFPTNSPLVSATPFDFFNSVSSPTPEITTQPFDLNLPSEETPVDQATPAPTAVPVVASSNNQLIIIGAVVGVVVLILVVVGIVLMRRNRNNEPPTSYPTNLPPQEPPTGPQYPPYINQQ